MSDQRKDFPQLSQESHYCDSAASSLTPQCVLDVMDEYYTTYRANIHRGLYAESVRASAEYDRARESVARFIGARKEEIIFTSGSTMASNMLTLMLERTLFWSPGQEILTTVMEHHSAMVPLQELANRHEVFMRYIPVTGTTLDENGVDLINKNTRIVSVMLASNVLGTINDLSQIIATAKAKNAIVIADATAYVGHARLDVQTLGVNALFFSGHKILGPTGVGVLWVQKELLEKMSPVFFGGDMIEKVTLDGSTWAEVPQRFEAGTPSIAGVIGLGRAVEYLEEVGVEHIQTHAQELVANATARLSEIPGVHIHSEKNAKKNIGTVTFTIEGVHAHDVGEILAREGVAVRVGHHCAMPLHKELGLPATVRASFYLYNTEADVDALVAGVKKVQDIFSV